MGYVAEPVQKKADCKKEKIFAQKNKRKQMPPEQVLDCN